MSSLNYFGISVIVLASLAILISPIGVMPAFASNNPYLICPDCNGAPGPLTPVTVPTPYGNGTILHLMIIYNTLPTEDTGLGDYNKAVNFEKVKPIILGPGNPTTILQNLIDELGKQNGATQLEGQNIKRYNPDGSLTQTYANWWMENYVVGRLSADGFGAVLSNMQQGMSLQTAMNNIDQEMQKIINNFNVNATQQTSTNPPPSNTNFVTIVQRAGTSAGADCVTAKNCFNPSIIHIDPQTTVIWRNNDQASHTITSGKVGDNDAGSLFDSGLVKSGNTFQFTFATAGTYDYFCTVHPWMIGQVIVGVSGQPIPNLQPTPPPSIPTMPSPPGGKIEYKTQASDGTTVLVITATPTSGQPLSLGIEFKDSTGNFVKHQNYAITVTQDNAIVLSVSDGHTHTGTDTQTTQSLSSADQINIQITLLGVGLPTTDPATWTGVKGEILSFSQDGQTTPPAPEDYKIISGVGKDAGSEMMTYNVQYSSVKNIVSSSVSIKDKSVNFVLVGNTDTSSTLILKLPTGLISGPFIGIFEDGQIITNYTTTDEAGDTTMSIPINPLTMNISIVGTSVLNTSISTPMPTTQPAPVFTPTQQDIQNINQAKANQTIAAEVNIGTNQSQTRSIDNNVSVQTTQNTPDSLNVNVSAPSQTGPKVIAFNLNTTTINIANLKDLGVMYDGKLIQPAPNMDVILHAKPTDSPSFAIVVTQSGVQVLVLIPHFSTHSITIMNMSKVITPTVPEFPFAVIVLIIATFSIVLIPKIRQI